MDDTDSWIYVSNRTKRGGLACGCEGWRLCVVWLKVVMRTLCCLEETLEKGVQECMGCVLKFKKISPREGDFPIILLRGDCRRSWESSWRMGRGLFVICYFCSHFSAIPFLLNRRYTVPLLPMFIFCISLPAFRIHRVGCSFSAWRCLFCW